MPRAEPISLFQFQCIVCFIRLSSNNYDTSHCKCFQCSLFWLPTLSTDLFPLAFSWLRFAAAVRASIVALLVVHSFGIGRGLLVRAFFGWLCAKFPRVWFLSTTDGRTGISSEMTGKLCFARLTHLNKLKLWTKLGYYIIITLYEK